MSNRIDGYYWVKQNVGWRIAKWQRDCWYLVGGANTFEDSDWLQINEQRILNPDEYQYRYKDIYHELIVACNTLIRATIPDPLDNCELEIKNILDRIAQQESHETK